MQTEIVRVKIEFTQALLGSNPCPDKSTLGESVAVFSRNEEGHCVLMDYTVRGFFKKHVTDMCGEEIFFAEDPKKMVQNALFVRPRQILLRDKAGNPCTKTDRLTRPIRGTRMEGPRIIVATCEALPPGTTAEFEVQLIGSSALTVETVCKCLDRGLNVGLGAWHDTGSYGCFKWEETAVTREWERRPAGVL